ncbi:MAG: hypothetical protein K2P86_13840 [Xanthobacteraceae bacterium]|nr:hypothetical protein [Xanthobacteraceae bacterium]
MNVNALFVVAMIVVGAAAGWLFAVRPQLVAFPYMSYFTVLIAMAVLELGLMFSGRLQGPIKLEVRLAGLVLGIVASAVVTPMLAAK